MPRISENQYPKLILSEEAEPATPTAGTAKMFLDSADGLLKWKDDAGTVVTLDGGGLATGTAFPGSPTAGDRYRRSDLDYEVYVWDGTRWLSEVTYRGFLPLNPLSVSVWTSGSMSTSAANSFRAAMPGDRDIYVTRVDVLARVASTNNGSNYWTFEWGGNDGTGLVDLIGPLTSAAESPDTFFRLSATPDAVVDTGDLMLTSREVKVGSPGALNHLSYSHSYKTVAT